MRNPKESERAMREERRERPQSVSIWRFPGQGVQEKGMGYELFQHDPDVRNIYKEAEELVPGITEVSFFDLYDRQKQTRWTQLAIITYNDAYFTYLKKTNRDYSTPPLFVAGNSLGEYNALIAAGVLTRREALILVKARAEGMQIACEQNPGGLIYAMRRKPEHVGEVEKVMEDSEVAMCLENSDEQIILGGTRKQLTRALELLTERGIRNGEVDVAGAFHHPQLMAPAVPYLKEALSQVQIKKALYPIIANTTGLPITEPAEIEEEIINQLTHPVLWAKSMRYAAEHGVRKYLEVGKKGVLTRMEREKGVLEEIKTVVAGAAAAGAVTAAALVVGWKLTHPDHKEE